MEHSTPERVFAIADLHLSSVRPKPMDVFGPNWRDHPERIERAWRDCVGPDDLVLVAGDVSWAMKLDEALPDLAWLGRLPGRKVLVRGNHDYWWASIGKVRKAAPTSVLFLQNDALRFGDLAVGGTRLWDFPGLCWAPAEDLPPPSDSPAGEGRGGAPEDGEKIRTRELERLRMSLSRLAPEAAFRVAMLHYPPVGEAGESTAVTRLMAEYRVDLCVFGHLHALGTARERPGADTVVDGVRCVLTSSDWLDFAPKEVWTRA